MFKNITILIVAGAALSSMASELRAIHCESSGRTTENTFSYDGEVEYSSSGWSSVGTARLRERGANSPEKVMPASFKGDKVEIFPPDTLGKDEIIRFEYTKKILNAKRASFLTGHPKHYSSSITIEDGTHFRGRCYLR